MTKSILLYTISLLILLSQMSCAQQNKNQSAKKSPERRTSNDAGMVTNEKLEEKRAKKDKLERERLERVEEVKTSTLGSSGGGNTNTNTDPTVVESPELDNNNTGGVTPSAHQLQKEQAEDFYNTQFSYKLKDADIRWEFVPSAPKAAAEAEIISTSGFDADDATDEMAMEDDAPPVRAVHIRLSIKNRQSHPMWYIMPLFGDDNLQENGKFTTASSKTTRPFVGKEFSGYITEDSLGRLVQLEFHGANDHAFKALYVPPQSTVTFRNYAVDHWGDLESLELWGVKKLLVNGSKPLEAWLPYPALSDGNMVVYCPKDSPCDWRDLGINPTTGTERTDYPAGEVTFVQAEDFKKHYIPLKRRSD